MKQRAISICSGLSAGALLVFWIGFPGSLFAEASLIFKKERPKKEISGMPVRKSDVYRPRGKTDPFKPFLETEEDENRLAVGGALVPLSGLGEESGPKTELQRIPLSDLTLSAVMRRGGRVVAMVQSPDGRGYFVEKGTAIGTQGGVVDEVVCEDRSSPVGVESVRKIVVKEPRLTREGKVTETSIDIEMPSSGLEGSR